MIDKNLKRDQFSSMKIDLSDGVTVDLSNITSWILCSPWCIDHVNIVYIKLLVDNHVYIFM